MAMALPADLESAAGGLLPSAAQKLTTKAVQIPQALTLEPCFLHKGCSPSLPHKLTSRGAALACIAFAIYCIFMYFSTSNVSMVPCWALVSCLQTTTVWTSAGPSSLLPTSTNIHQSDPVLTETPTDLQHIVFGIASSASSWEYRKEYVRLWWQPPAGGTPRRGFVWLDQPVPTATNASGNSSALPDVRISGNTDNFSYTWEDGSPSAIRVSRIFSETFRLGLQNVRWFVMGDDDTIFFPENLVTILRKYDHKKLYYIGQSSESQKQSATHSFGMAYGGGGIALSYPLAEALEKMQDNCLTRYAHLYGSDSRIEACLAELGVPLTREPGFHQIDFHGDIFGFLAAHPVKPLVSLHHIDTVEPIFPGMTRLQALQHLFKGAASDWSSTLQQSICYDRHQNVTVSVSWGYAVQIFPTIMNALEVQKPSLTFVDWRTWQIDEDFFTMNVRRLPPNGCEGPTIYFMESVSVSQDGKTLIGVYKRKENNNNCYLSTQHDRVEVQKQPQSESWLMAPQRQGCEIVPQNYSGTGPSHPLFVHVRDLKDNEIIAP